MRSGKLFPFPLWGPLPVAANLQQQLQPFSSRNCSLPLLLPALVRKSSPLSGSRALHHPVLVSLNSAHLLENIPFVELFSVT